MKKLSDVIDRYVWTVYAYCLMGNHYHLLLRTEKANLSRGMRQLNGVYAQYFNRRHKRVGHVFQGRFKTILVEDEEKLLTVARYVALYPVRAGMVDGERYAARPDLEEIFSNHDRDTGIYMAIHKYGYTLRSVGDFLGMHYSAVSRIANRVARSAS